MRVAAKAAATLFAVFGLWQVAAGFLYHAEMARQWVFDEPLAAPLLYIPFYAIQLLHECIVRSQRAEMEAMRSNPLERRSLGKGGSPALRAPDAATQGDEILTNRDHMGNGDT